MTHVIVIGSAPENQTDLIWYKVLIERREGSIVRLVNAFRDPKPQP